MIGTETSTIPRTHSIGERKFYSGMAIAILITVLIGFARSFFLRPLFPGHPSPPEPIFYVHGVVFTLWIFLFVAQVTLIAKGRADLHRKIGLPSALLVVVMVVIGLLSALHAGSRPSGFVGIPVPALQFMAVPFFDMILFGTFVTMAYLRRFKLQSHKRWMLLATLNLITAAIARWPVVNTLGPVAYFALTDLFIVALAIWDFRSSGKLHRVTLWGGLAIIISQPLRLIIMGTSGWQNFAQWATELVR